MPISPANHAAITHEPLVRIGIVLPGDCYQTLRIHTPLRPAYGIRAPASNSYTPLLPEKDYQLHLTSRGIGWQGPYPPGKVGAAGVSPQLAATSVEWEITPLQPESLLEPHCGITVRQVMAGRGFHWQKRLDQQLRGKLVVRSRGNSLWLCNEVGLEDYLASVVCSEMNASCPPALLQAQAIAARSWALAHVEAKHQDLGVDFCNDDCCQRYQGTGHLSKASLRALQATRAVVLMYGARICDARYSKSCGGISESFSTVWHGPAHPYLPSRPDAPPDFTLSAWPGHGRAPLMRWLHSCPATFCSPHYIPEAELAAYLGKVDQAGRYFRWHLRWEHDALLELLQRKLNLSAARLLRFVPLMRSPAGRLQVLRIVYRDSRQRRGYYDLRGENMVRQALHPRFLYSSLFDIQVQDDVFLIQGAGWGHGVGLCQIGALGMALAGYSSRDILQHYYPGAQLRSLY